MPPKFVYSPLSHCLVARPVDRLDFLAQESKGKRVLDLGCYDETALIKKNTRYWLHGRLAELAEEVIGFDSSPSIPEHGIATSSSSRILRGDVLDISSLDFSRVENIIAGELIEHLPNTLSFLQKIAASPKCQGATLYFTTPNASALHNSLLAFVNRESQHHDHLQIYSLKTLNTLCQRAGFSDWEIIPYHVRFTEMILSAPGLVRTLLLTMERLVNAAEWLLPMISGGWIVRARI